MPDGITGLDVDECEERLADALERAMVPPEMWGRLWQEDYVLPAIREGYNSAEWRELVEAARTFEHEAREAATGTNLPPAGRDRKPRETAGAELDDYTRHRAEVFSEVAGVLANMWAKVRRFRHVYLGSTDAKLTEAEAASWLFGDGMEMMTARQDMSEISRLLSRAYRWRTREANWFLLTGDVPFVHPISISVSQTRHRDFPSYLNKCYQLPGYAFDVGTGEIIVTVEPWVDAETVSQEFREVQRQILGGDNRKTTTKVLEAVRFVVRRLKENRVIWSKLQAEWNRTHPELRYNSRGGLSKAFRRFLQPGYESPKFADFELTPAQRWEKEYRRRKTERIRKRFG